MKNKKKLAENGNTWMWDDAKQNKSIIGGLFGFVFIILVKVIETFYI